jgi:mannose-6-phosphate isomerase-like protein (cupin superfamily)
MVNQVVHRSGKTARAYWGPGDKYTFLVTGDETGGSYFTMEVEVPPGAGPPRHIHHRNEEQFYILEGEVTIQAGQQTFHTTKGDLVHVPRGTVYTFRNMGQAPARMLVTYSPAGIEKLFEQAFTPASDGQSPPALNPEEMIARFKTLEADFGMETFWSDIPGM